MIKYLVFLFSSFSMFALTGHKEIKNIHEIHKDLQIALEQGHQASRTLLVFDIDNTVLAAEGYLGSDQWYTWKSSLIQQNNPAAYPVLLEWYGIALTHAPMRVTEKNWEVFIKSWQRVGYPVIALTSRSVGFRAPTLRELERNKISFKKTAIGKAFPGRIIPPGAKRYVSYDDGVYMTSGQHKGAMLNYLIRAQYRGQMPFTQIVFVDDHLKNTTRVYETFRNLGVDILSYRYGFEDRNVKEFHSNNGMKAQATKQLKELQQMLLKIFKTAPPLI